MGKIKRNKYKYHSSAPVSMETDSKQENDTLKQNSSLVISPIQQLGPVQVKNNIFGNIVIPPSVLKQELPHASQLQRRKENPVKFKESFPLSVDVKKILAAQKKLNKKARLTVAQVSAECKKKREEEKSQTKKKKKAVLGSWKSLKDALSEAKDSNTGHLLQIPGSKTKRKDIDQQMIQDMSAFSSALQFFSWNKTE